MNWDAVGALAELVGALGVVASLAYLAIQIRQSTAQSRLNTNAIEASAFQQLLDHHAAFNMKLVDDPRLLEALVSPDVSSLDPLERRRFLIWVTAFFRSYYNAWSLFEKGLISEAQWSLFEMTLARIGSDHKPIRDSWELRRGEFPSRFSDVVDKSFDVRPSDGEGK
jgi:hypothetical protein